MMTVQETGRPRALLLDLDGTIADTLPHIFDTYRHAVAPWAETPPTDAEIAATFGPSERHCIERLAPGADLDAAVHRFHEYHEAHHTGRVAPVEGIAEAIDVARSLNWRVGVFTGKGRRAAEFSLVDLGLRDRIEHLVSGTDVTRAKPDPEGIGLAADALGVDPRRVLMVGDSPADVQAGRSAGAKTAAALWLAFWPERLQEAGADFVCRRVEELVAAIRSLDAEG